MQSQIIHGSNVFGDIADVICELRNERDRARDSLSKLDAAIEHFFPILNKYRGQNRWDWLNSAREASENTLRSVS